MISPSALHAFARFRPRFIWLQLIIVASVLTFPLTIYEGYFRQVIALAVSLILGGILLVPLVGLVRRLGKSWWVGAAVTILLLASVIFVFPVYIAPLFNNYTKLQDARIKDAILSMARANGIPATDVYEFDDSRQSNRVSANVSGFAGTQRISLNDNLLKRCTLGHPRNKPVAVLPLAVIGLSVYFSLLTPVTNTITRTMEFEEDMYGLNAARQPDGELNVDLMLGEYRKLDPGPIEELVFFDHPSGRTRITAAMRLEGGTPGVGIAGRTGQNPFQHCVGKTYCEVGAERVTFPLQEQRLEYRS